MTTEQNFRDWLKSNYGIQEYNNYANTQTEELAVQYAKQAAQQVVEKLKIAVNQHMTFSGINAGDYIPKQEIEEIIVDFESGVLSRK